MNTGGCACGAVRYEVTGKLTKVAFCHCSKCRRWHGHVGAYTAVDRPGFRLTDERGLAWFSLSPTVRRGFCSQCGSSLLWDETGEAKMSICAGTLDGPTGLTSKAHIFLASKGDYYEVPDDGLLRFDAEPPRPAAGGVALALRFQLDDLTGDAVRALVREHVARMHLHSPPESVHAFDVDALRRPEVRFWSAWSGDELAGCGALADLGDGRGELKSMRVPDAFLGKGAGRAMLEHLIADARARGLKSLWLETGSAEAFLPARQLYERAGFRLTGPFADYVEDPYSLYMTREL
jgi:putative acetyltransferase